MIEDEAQAQSALTRDYEIKIEPIRPPLAHARHVVSPATDLRRSRGAGTPYAKTRRSRSRAPREEFRSRRSSLYRAVLAQDSRRVRGLVRPRLRLGFPPAVRRGNRRLSPRPGAAPCATPACTSIWAPPCAPLATSAMQSETFRLVRRPPEPEIRAMSLRNLACIAPGDPALDDGGHPRHPASLGRAGGREDLLPPGPRYTTVPGERLRLAYLRHVLRRAELDENVPGRAERARPRPIRSQPDRRRCSTLRGLRIP